MNQREALRARLQAGKIIPAGGEYYAVSAARKFIVVDIDVASGGTSGETIFKSVKTVLIEKATAHCTATGGLSVCRFGWKGDGGDRGDFFGLQASQEGKFPIASTILSDASVTRLDRWDLVFPKNTDRTFIAEQVTGTAASDYTLSVTLHVRELVKLPSSLTAILKECECG
jgi:hypothetical protein